MVSILAADMNLEVAPFVKLDPALAARHDQFGNSCLRRKELAPYGAGEDFLVVSDHGVGGRRCAHRRRMLRPTAPGEEEGLGVTGVGPDRVGSIEGR